MSLDSISTNGVLFMTITILTIICLVGCLSSFLAIRFEEYKRRKTNYALIRKYHKKLQTLLKSKEDHND